MNDDLIEDIVEYHYKNLEHLFVQSLIEQDKKFAEKVYFELQMQLYLSDTDNENSLFNEE